MAPLFKALSRTGKKYGPVSLSETEKQIVQSIKEELTSNLKLSFLDPRLELVCQIDSSRIGVGMVLLTRSSKEANDDQIVFNYREMIYC
jgi:hypothetical protein